jgi:hypothetical protein
MVKLPGYASIVPVNPYGITGAIMALTRAAIARAIATGAKMSAPFAVTPWGSIVPSGSKTVLIFAGTQSRNSIQLMRSSSRVVGPFLSVKRVTCRGFLLLFQLTIEMLRFKKDPSAGAKNIRCMDDRP